MIQIRFQIAKNGQRKAFYFGLAQRWLPISVAKAEAAIASGVLFGKKVVQS